MKRLLLLIAVILFFKINLFAQNQDIQIGAGLNANRLTTTGFFDYSDPQAVNIKVAVWGFVRYPGKYIIPAYSNVNDLLSYAGGPTDAAHLDNLKLYRTNKDSSQTIFNLHYKDFLNYADVNTVPARVPKLMPGDILLVTGEPRLYFSNYFSIIVTTVSTLISIATLVYLIVKK
jgi:hypothetical protein